MHAAGRMRCSPAGMQSQTHPLIFTSHTFALMAITASLTFALFTYFRLPIISSVDAGTVVSCFSRTRQLQAAANEGVQLRPENLKTSHIWALHSRTVSEDSNGAFQVIYKDVESLDATLSPINGVPSTLDFTISAWVRLRHTTSESRCIASHGEPGERWSMLVVPSGNLQLSLWLSSGQKVVFECILALRLGVWSHIAVGYKSENGRASFYLNGHLVPHSSHKSIKNIVSGIFQKL